MKKVLHHIFSMSFLVEVVLVIFAIASASTISDYSIKSNMNIITSYSIGIGMGTILVIMAILLSRIEQKASEFKVLFVATILVAALSGILQSLAYIEITGNIITSVVKGLGFPMVEVALAYAVSKYITYTKKKELENADQQFDEQLALMQNDAMSELDADKVKAQVEEKMQQIINARINKFTKDQLKKYDVEDSTVDTNNVDLIQRIQHLEEVVNMLTTQQFNMLNQHVEPTTNQHNKSTSIQHVDNATIQHVESTLDQHVESTPIQHSVDTGVVNNQHVESTTINDYVDQHPKSTSNIKQQRQQQLLNMLNELNGQQSTVLNKKQLAVALSTTDTTINRDLNELQQRKLININGIVEVYATTV